MCCFRSSLFGNYLLSASRIAAIWEFELRHSSSDRITPSCPPVSPFSRFSLIRIHYLCAYCPNFYRNYCNRSVRATASHSQRCAFEHHLYFVQSFTFQAIYKFLRIRGSCVIHSLSSLLRRQQVENWRLICQLTRILMEQDGAFDFIHLLFVLYSCCSVLNFLFSYSTQSWRSYSRAWGAFDPRPPPPKKKPKN